MNHSMLRRLMMMVCAGLVIAAGATVTQGKKPPWAQDDKHNPPPVSAPESSAISLIGMGASALAGYYLGRRKRDTGKRIEALEKETELLEGGRKP